MHGRPKDGIAEMEIEEHELDLRTKGQLTEGFLCEINPMGQVPVMVNPGVLPIPLPDSLDISYYICDRYPSLLPAEHKNKIMKLLYDLHEINFFSLSFTHGPSVAQGVRADILRLLAIPGISQRYVEALKYKLEMNQTHKIDALDPEAVKHEVERTQAWLSEIDAILAMRPADRESAWLYGGDTPTVLDAHLTVFVARLRDVNRENLIPQRVNQFGDLVMSTPIWLDFMAGRRTMRQKPTDM